MTTQAISVGHTCAISRTRRWKGSLRISSSVDFWYLRISRSCDEGKHDGAGGTRQTRATAVSTEK